MALMDGALKGMLDNIADNPMVKDAMQKFEPIAKGIVQAMTHFNSRFDTLETQGKAIDDKVSRVLYLLEHPSSFAPAGDDGLMKLLSQSGEEMIMQAQPEPMPIVNVSHESEVSTIPN